MTSGQYYWMGAIAYSTWKWTDGSPFYKYVGYSTEPLSDGYHVDGNSASRCHLMCEEDEPFGLRGETCFCGVSDQVQMTWNQTEVRCPGNYDERCGNQDGLSVYRTGEIAFDADDKDMCVYAELKWFGKETKYYSSSCDTSRSAACKNGTVLNELRSSTDSGNKCSKSVCVHHTPNQWDEANRTCNLVTVTSTNKKDLHNAMEYTYRLDEEKYTYWIGLRRGYVKKWLNGSDVLDSVHPYTADKLCLSTTGTSLFRWEDCSKKTLPTICESASPKMTRSTTSSVLHTTLQSIDTGTSTTMTTTTTTTMSVLTSQASRVVIQQTTEPFSDKHDQGNNNMGLYYGLSVLGVVSVAVVITLLLVLYKQKRCCFASAPVDPKVNSLPLVSMDNNLYLCTMDVQTEQGAVLEPSATANGNCVDDEYDLLGQNKRGCANEETGNAAAGKPVSHHDGRGAYDRVLKGQNIQDETYDHGRENGTVRKGDDVYDHAGDKCTVRKGDDVYDHAGDNGTVRKGDDVYDHAGAKGTVRKGDDVYDHADHGTVSNGDDVYDHAGAKDTVRKVDDVYDHADHGTVSKGDDVYDHAGEDSCYYNMR
ncbi:uncharacterized protein LOC124285980 isoform X2 [Haliotis rubra]|uniref:uncharacterized protein LOC124285980 isoform X2 n=1 Tax=Haliotis rubra TaxID=36100 RepID=UPI001EE5CE80|nr:uncharacterized protein LOC124285980 isoform X2 [Haliotis rubra]